MHNPQIENNFTYHEPDRYKIDQLKMIRKEGKVLATMIDEKVPQSREKSIALTKLEECIMWANAGIVRNE
jgi:hypothetical protein